MSGREELPVAILGGGIAGLTAARALRRRGIPVRLFEAGARVAGLAASVSDEEGFSFDFGAHFITNRLAKAVGVERTCRDVHRYGETVLLGDKRYGYPFGLLRSSRYVLSAVASRLQRGRAESTEGQSAAEWFRDAYGAALADEVALPLVEEWSGVSASDLAASVGSKIPSGILRTMALKALGRITRRAIAVGYCRELPETPSTWHVYPEGGVAALCEHLAQELNGVVQLESPVEQILVEDGRAVGVRVHGRELRTSAVVSTAPVHVLPRLVVGTDALQPLAEFRYRPMIFVNLKLMGRRLLPDVVLWTPERKFPFFRLTEATQSMPWLAPAGKTIITVDIGAQVGDANWSRSDEQLIAYAADHLEGVIPDVRRRLLGGRVMRTPIAYPVFLKKYEVDRVRFQHDTGVDGLYSVGRNGEFDHLLMEDVFVRTERRMETVVRNLKAPRLADALA